MSLRTRLFLLASVLVLGSLIAGIVLAIASARRAVAEETQSTAMLAAELIELALDGSNLRDSAELRAGFLERLARLEDARHLSVAVIPGTGDAIELSAPDTPTLSAPAWFAALVRPEQTRFERALIDTSGGRTGILISADPTDEIAEAWQEARLMLGLILGLTLAGALPVFVLIGRWLRPLASVSDAMDRLQQGDYADRLPSFDLPELTRVAGHFNRLAAALEQSRDENRGLTRRSLSIQEQERRALAQELHDELGQSITAIKALAVSIQRSDVETSEKNATSARTIAEICSHMYTVVRSMMTRLRPALLDDFGLAAALQDLVDRWNEHFADTFCSLELDGSLDGLPDDIQIGAFRIVQECLTNVGKHARAAAVRVSVRRVLADGGDCLAIVVADDGIGLDAATVPAGFGLRGIRERADALRGDVALERSDRGGLSVSVMIPIVRQRSAA